MVYTLPSNRNECFHFPRINETSLPFGSSFFSVCHPFVAFVFVLECIDWKILCATDGYDFVYPNDRASEQ